MQQDRLLKALSVAAIAALGLLFWPESGSAGEDRPARSIFDWMEDEPKEAASDTDEVLEAMEVVFSKLQGMAMIELMEHYTEAREKAKTVAKFKRFQELFGSELKARALCSDDRSEVRDIGLMLHEDGFNVIEVLKRAYMLLQDSDRYDEVSVTTADGSVKKQRIQTHTYKRLCEIIGYQKYIEPPEFDDYQRWEISEWVHWAKKLREFKTETGGDDIFSPKQLEEIKALESACRTEGEKLKADHARDNFAITAREAFVRFRSVNKKGMKRAMFSPEDLNRGDEDVADVWDYTYWRPFIVYVEKPKGGDAAHLKSSFESKANLLMQLEKWFRASLVEPYGLRRVVPLPQAGDEPGPFVSRKPELAGRKFETRGQMAEAEGWPLEVIVLKDGHTYEQFCKEHELVCGQRGHYYPPLRHVVIWEDSKAVSGGELNTLTESALIREAFQMLADHYAADPIDWVFEKVGGKKLWKPAQSRPRFANLLVQEGLADAVAGFTNESQGANARYTFLEPNLQRIKDWQAAFENFTNRQNLFRIQDMLKCTALPGCRQVGTQRCKDLQLKAALPEDFLAKLHRASATQAVYFFHHFKENGQFKYRQKWSDYVKADFTGAIKRTDFSAEPGIKTFKEAFGIETDADFDALEAEFVKFTSELKTG